MLLKNKKRYLPLLIAGLVLLQIGCKSAAKPEQQHAEAEEKHWGYTGDTGPDYWYALNHAYSLARDGKAQSPIDISTADLAPASDGLTKPEFHYAGIPFKMENNGHTIELVPSDYSNYIILDGAEYALQQAHFHAPSEHTINGEPAAMEIHLVHKDAGGNLAVVGILIASGAENEILKEAFANLPHETNEEAEEALGEPVDLSALLAADAALYRYDGSLTTPPCTEGVKWSVADKPLEMSQAQIDAFTAIYSGNSRPVQNLHERIVYITN